MVDVRMLEESQKFKDIEDSYIIFITQNDVMKKGLPLYHVERVVKETEEDFGDGSHIIYVNGAYKNDEDPKPWNFWMFLRISGHIINHCFSIRK